MEGYVNILSKFVCLRIQKPSPTGSVNTHQREVYCYFLEIKPLYAKIYMSAVFVYHMLFNILEVHYITYYM